ncbi:MAG TPA: Bro-N domain-containing protein, partial [Candidatus Saccharimonadales bacterium]|nr:Bro-N domain-containing protein [Candidatus Saccharimonadales bacterium]
MKNIKDKRIALFQGKEIRKIWDDNSEIWYFSVVDIIAALTDSSVPRRYWSDLKIKLKDEGSQVYDKIVQFKMLAGDNKARETDAADTESVFRIIQSIPSPKAEPFKQWLARVGYERVEEVEDPEKAIQRGLATYLKKGYSKEWVDLRLKNIEIRKDL